MIKTWFFGLWWVSIKLERNYWRWAVGKYGSKKEYTGKSKEEAIALNDALNELSRLAASVEQEG